MANDIVVGKEVVGNKLEVPKFNYFEAVSQNVQIFFMKVLEHFCSKLKASGADVGYSAFLQIAPLSHDPEHLLESLGGQLVPELLSEFPLNGSRYLMEEYAGVSDKKDSVYKFTQFTKNPCWLSVISNMTISENAIIFRQNSAIMAASKEDADVLLAKIYEKSRDHTIDHKIVGFDGEPLEGFKPMQPEDLFLPDHIKKDLLDNIDTFFKSEELYKEHGLEWRRGCLVLGAPGNGKSSLARVISTIAKVPCILVEFNGGLDPSEVLAIASDTAKRLEPAIIIFDDLNLYVQSDDPILRASLLTMLDGMLNKTSGIFIIATASHQGAIDPAISQRPSRFDMLKLVPFPESKERELLFTAKMGKYIKNFNKSQIKEIVSKMKTLSCASVQECAVNTLLSSITAKRKIDVALVEESIQQIKHHIKIGIEGMESMQRGRMGFDGDCDCEHC